MHRRNLVIRRFGPLEFGLGYYRDGVWVDHADDDGSLADREPALDAVHDLLSCCTEPRPARDRGMTVSPEARLQIAAR